MRILEVNADITERKRAEQGLRESQSCFEGVIDSAMDAIISVDEDQWVNLFNAAAERMFGCTAAEALGKTLDLSSHAHNCQTPKLQPFAPS